MTAGILKADLETSVDVLHVLCGTKEQISTLRNIIEQYIEWNSNLYVCFVDLKKAFDSVDRSVLWRIMRSYSIPVKIVKMARK